MDNIKIPIRNLYYMLCYAWNVLPQKGEAICGTEPFDNIYNLSARILLFHVKRLLRRGFHREYIPIYETCSTPHGKIDFSASLRQQTLLEKKLVCHCDVFSSDVTFNQIIKTAIGLLLHAPTLDKGLRKELYQLYHSFAEIHEITPTAKIFSTLRYGQSNRNYRLIINVCQLLFEGLVSRENGNNLHYAGFLRDSYMAKLYEKFVFHYFIHHLPKATFRVHAPKLHWEMEENRKDFPYLPEMRTDIVLDNKETQTRFIIDTKYYPKPLRKSSHGTKEIINPSNLYQIYTYINNSGFDGPVMGMLLYPTVHQDLDLKYPMRDKSIFVKTLNLNTDWPCIERRLMDIAALTINIT